MAGGHDVGVPTVLLTTDGSDFAAESMARGIEVLGRHHRFVALSVVAPTGPAITFSPMAPVPDPAVGMEVEDRMASEQSEHLTRLLDRLGIEAEAQVVVGDAGPAICEVAAEIGADVVVVGSHGHGRLKAMLLGSVSRHVLDHAGCPVLAIRY